MDDLNGKVALVTGASRGIGRAVALALAGAGASVAVNYRIHDGAAVKVVSQIEGLGRKAVAIQADVSVGADIHRLANFVERKLGTPTILVNNAGIGIARSIEDVTEQDWDHTLDTNLKSAFLMIQALLPGMRSCKWGRIVNLSSGAAHTGGVVGPHYAASKAGMIGLTHYYAARLVKEGITINVIAPGPVATDMVADLPQLTPAIVPIGRFGQTEEIAEAALMIVRNAYLTGQTINVNGGLYMT
jgi:3-oxoacyl-[acyl-carrier protein] reductase